MSKENPISFPLGNNVATPQAIQLLAHDTMVSLILRHAANDWGDLCDEDKNLNEIALKYGERLISCYVVNDDKFYVITEADRSVTTLLFWEEY